MTRTAHPLHIPDLSAMTRSLQGKLTAAARLPGHLALMNMLAQAAGYCNVQHLRATVLRAEVPVEPRADVARVAQVLRHFDAQGGLMRWPSRTWQQRLAVRALWSHLPARTAMTEREISALLDRWHCFGDAAILRRTMVELRLVNRKADGQEYLRVEQDPGPEAKALIQALHGRGLG